MGPTRTTWAAEPLPSPADRPHADVVVYDGECQFCRGQVARLHRWDGQARLAFLSLHDPEAQTRCPGRTHQDLMDEMVVVEPNGKQHGGAEAIRYLSRRLPMLWPTAPFLHVPFSMPLWRWLYRQVAVRRYRWNDPDCASGSCQVHFGGKR